MSAGNGGDMADRSERSIVRELARLTAPGVDNDVIIDNILNASGVVRDFVEDTNNWFEIVDVRVYRDGSIGIPARYRWTIRRWSSMNMDEWLVNNGWEVLAHLNADSREHRQHEMEARYRKRYDKTPVYANFYVEFTEDVFEKLSEKSGGR